MSIKATGSSFSEAILNYLQKTEMCDSSVLPDLKSSFESSPIVSPLYVGINLRHTVGETLEYLKLFNKLNQDYLPSFLPFLQRLTFRKQAFSTPNSYKPERPRAVKRDDDDELSGTHYDNSVLVLGDSEDIVLLDHFHVTLYFLGVDKKPEEMILHDVHMVEEYLTDKDPNFKAMLNTLTLYEFSVCLMYRNLYKMHFPFEKVKVSEEHDEVGSIKYLVLVPGVVFFAITELKKPLFAIPAKDFTNNRSPGGSSGDEAYTAEDLFKFLKTSVLVENEHSTHVTLGTSKDFKPVISNQICISLINFLNNCDSSQVYLYSNSENSDSGLHKELNKHLKVYNSGDCKYDNLKDVFIRSLPHLLDNEPSTNSGLPPVFTLNETFSHKRGQHVLEESKYKDWYSETRVFASDDYKWFYFNNLPATQRLFSEHSRERFDWYIDVYIMSYEKEVKGHMHFNQK